MTKNYFFLAIAATLIAFSCKTNTPEPTPVVIPLTKSLVLKVVETDSGAVLTWKKINFSETDVWNYKVIRCRDISSICIFSPWAGDYEWSVYKDSTTLDKAPPFSDRTYYQVTASLSSGEKITSFWFELTFNNASFYKGYKTVVSYLDTANSTAFICDAYSKKIRSINYLTKLTTETSVETEMFNGGFMLGVTNGTAKELYAGSRAYGLINIFDRNTLNLKKTINSFTPSYVSKNGLMYFSNSGTINVMKLSDNTFIQSFTGFANNGDLMLFVVPNTNKLIGISSSILNKVKEFTLNTDGTIQSVKEFSPPANSAGDNIYGNNAKIHPTNGTLITGSKGSIYSLTDFSYQNSLNLNLGIALPEFTFSPDGKYLAVSTNTLESSVVIYNFPALTKKFSFDVPDCFIQNLSFDKNNVVIIANNKYTDYITGTVVMNKKIPN